jgi:hypothetical protein
MTNYICEFCNKHFSSSSNLITHKRTAKYCLNIQKEKIPSMEIKIREFRCELCNVIFINKNSLSQHTVLCKSENEQKIMINKLEVNIKNKEQQIKDLQDELLKIKLENAELKAILKSKSAIFEKDHECILQMAKQPKNNTNNTNVQNILAPLDLNTVLDKFSHVNFTNKDIMEGQAGVARLLAPCLTDDTGKKMIKISDISRGIFTSIDDSGNIIKDIKAQKLAIAIEPIATEKVIKIIELDDLKRNKILELCILKRNKKEREKEINEFYATMAGISNKETLKYYNEQIENRKKQNLIDQQKINEYIKNGIDEITVEEMDLILLELKDGLEDIKDLKTNSNKFSSTLSKVIE